METPKSFENEYRFRRFYGKIAAFTKWKKLSKEELAEIRQMNVQ